MKNSASKTTHKPGIRSLSAIAALTVVVLLVLVTPQASLSQGITGSISGTVTDPSGAAIGKATVTISNVDTGATRIIQTSDAGTYEVTQLLPGNYNVKVDKVGFKVFEQKAITIQIDQVAVVNAQLPVGSEQTTVTVTSAPAVIQTQDSSVGQVIDSQAIQNTPLNGRLTRGAWSHLRSGHG
jgi:hypothetical protein